MYMKPKLQLSLFFCEDHALPETEQMTLDTEQTGLHLGQNSQTCLLLFASKKERSAVYIFKTRW